MKPTPKSVILDLLSTLRPGASMPVRTLIEAGSILGLEENGVRVALTRLRGERVVEADERGRYRLGVAGDAVRRHVTSWRRIETRLRPWRGDWIAAFTGALPRSERARVRSTQRTLRLLGFAALERGLELRPDNLVGGIESLRQSAAELGMDARVTLFAASDLDHEVRARATRLWDVAWLQDRYRALIRELRESTTRLKQLVAGSEVEGNNGLANRALAGAMRESFLVGGRAIRQIVHDPLLPHEICPHSYRIELGNALRDYDRLGRACWRPFMRAHGIVPSRAPGAARPIEAAGLATA
jgi:phenylacetic acid degradation operon negative regulatory protein